MKIILIGYGRMGKAIEEICLAENHEITLRIHAENTECLTPDHLRQADVAIEFTSPGSAVNNLNACLDAGIPVVCGTTGWLDEWENVKQRCIEKNGTLLYASNFSIGVNIFFEVNKKLAALMAARPSYDVTIEEIHHTMKKDAPSGTAITLAEQVLASVHRKHKWVNEKSVNPSELVISSKRIDPAPGTHIVKYTSPVDDIEIMHTAHNRVGFASGAVLAAAFIRNKKGIFGMKDVLGF